MEHCGSLEGTAKTACLQRNAAERAEITERVRARGGSPPLRRAAGEDTRPVRSIRADFSTPGERAVGRSDLRRRQEEEGGSKTIRFLKNAQVLVSMARRAALNLLNNSRDKVYNFLADEIPKLPRNANAALNAAGDRLYEVAGSIKPLVGFPEPDERTEAREAVMELIRPDPDKAQMLNALPEEAVAAAAQFSVAAVQSFLERAVRAPLSTIATLINDIGLKFMEPFNIAKEEVRLRGMGYTARAARTMAEGINRRKKEEFNDGQIQLRLIQDDAFRSFAERLPGDPSGVAAKSGSVAGAIGGDVSSYWTGGAILGKTFAAYARMRGTTSVFSGLQPTRGKIFLRNIGAGIPGDVLMSMNPETSMATFLAEATGNPFFKDMSENAIARMFFEVSLGVGAELGMSRVFKGWQETEIRDSFRKMRAEALQKVIDTRRATATGWRVISNAESRINNPIPDRIKAYKDGNIVVADVSFNEQQVYDARRSRMEAILSDQPVDPRTEALANTVMPHEFQDMSPQERIGLDIKQNEAGLPERIAVYPDGVPGYATRMAAKGSQEETKLTLASGAVLSGSPVNVEFGNVLDAVSSSNVNAYVTVSTGARDVPDTTVPVQSFKLDEQGNVVSFQAINPAATGGPAADNLIDIPVADVSSAEVRSIRADGKMETSSLEIGGTLDDDILAVTLATADSESTVVGRRAWSDADRIEEENLRQLGVQSVEGAEPKPQNIETQEALDAFLRSEAVRGRGNQPTRRVVAEGEGTELFPVGHKTISVRLGNVDVEMSVEGNTLNLKEVGRVEGTPSGQSTETMLRLLEAMDEKGITVTLEALPLVPAEGVQGLSTDGLISWYQRMGFERITDKEQAITVMVRRPKGEVGPQKGYVTTRGRFASRADAQKLELEARGLPEDDRLGMLQHQPRQTDLNRPDVAARHGTPAGRALTDRPLEQAKLDALHSGVILDDKSGFGPVRSFFQEYMGTERLAPSGVFQANGALRGRLAGFERLLASTSIEFKQAFGRGTRFTEDQINAMLAGRRSLDDLNPDQVRSMRKMRNIIDDLSREAIRSGVAQGDLALVFTENLGFYMTRSYQIFRDPKWASRVRTKYPERVTQAKDWIRKENPTLTEEEVELWIDKVLYVGENSGSPMDVLRRGNLPGMSDMSSLRKRGDVPGVIRELWGEDSSPVLNFLRSTTNLFHMIENHKFLQDINLRGQGNIFFPEATPNAKGRSFIHEIKVDHPALKPLEGMYTTPDIAASLREMGGYDRTQVDNMFGNVYLAVNQAAKWTKTVGSQQGHIRNVIAWPAIWLAQGQFGALRNARTGMDVIPFMRDRLGGKTTVEWNAYIKRLSELGVVGEVAIAGELRSLSNKFMNTENAFSPLRLQEATGLGKIVPAMNSAYRSGDDFGKIVAFEAERARYRNAFLDKEGVLTITEDELDRQVAAITRATTPNYSNLPKVVTDIIGRAPVGDFVAFPTEMIRVLGATTVQIQKELFSTNPVIRKIGAQRLVGLTSAMTLTGAASIASAYVYGYSPEERAAVRRGVPPWTRNSELIYLPRDDNGNIRYIDMGYTDPFSHGKQVLIGWLRGDDPQESLFNAGWAALSPFISPEMTVELMADVVRNENQNVYLDSDSPAEKAMKSIAYIAREGITPSTIESYRKILSGVINKEANLWGPQYDPMTEAIAAFSGIRITVLDPTRKFTFGVNEFSNDVDSNLDVVRNVMTRPGRVTEEEIRKAYAEMEGRREDFFGYMVTGLRDARVLGVGADETFEILENKVNTRMALDIEDEMYQPWRPSSVFLEGTKNAIASQSRTPDEVKEEFDARIEILMNVVDEYESVHVPRAQRRER